MKQSELDLIVNEFIDHSAKLLVSKGTEYAQSTGDRLTNFKEVARFLNKTPEEVALVYLMKHVQSIQNGIEKGDFDWRWQKDDGSEAFKSRFADAINYLLLLAAIIEEARVD